MSADAHMMARRSPAGRGDLAELKRLHAAGTRFDYRSYMDAALEGHLDVVKWLYSIDVPECEDICYYAAEGGHGDILYWALTQGCPITEATCDNAACSGQFEILKLLRKWGIPWNRDFCLEITRQHGRADMASWIESQPN